MNPEAAVQMPLWAILLTTLAGPAFVWVWNAAKPIWENSQARRDSAEAARIAKENADAERLKAAADAAAERANALLLGQIAELRQQIKEKDGEHREAMSAKDGEIRELRDLHRACEARTDEAVALASEAKAEVRVLEERLRANSERVSGLSSENSALRKLTVAYEAKYGALAEDSGH